MNTCSPTRFSTAAITALLAIASLHGAVSATNNDKNPNLPAIELDPYEVNADRGDQRTVPVAEYARFELALTPGGTEVVVADRFLRGRASTVNDTFALSAGVFAQSRFGSDEARLSIRGSGLQRTFHGRGLRLLQDGVPLNLADGGFDFQALEPLSTSYVNVWRGGNALALGASTLGGAIDYVSRTGRDAPRLFTRVEAGSFGYLRASIAGGGAHGERDAYVSFTHQSQDGSRDHARQNNQRLFANAGVRVRENIETRFFFTGVRTDSELPGNLTKAQLRANPRQAAAGNLALDQKRDFDLVRVANKTTVRTGDTFWDFTAGWTYKDLDHPIFQVIDQLSNDQLVAITATHTGELAGHRHRLRAGMLYNRGRTHAANFVNVGGRRGAIVSQAEQIATNLEAFFEDQLTLRHGVTLVVGASAAHNRRENIREVGGAPSYDYDFDRLAPKLGLRWDHGTMQAYANLSGSYEPPSFSETLTNNAPRDAQTATTLEVGTRGSHGAVRWDVSLYSARVRRELLALVDPVTQLTATINADRTTHRGIEFSGEIDLLGHREANVAPRQRVVLRGAWTYGSFRFDDDARYGNNTLAGLPPHFVSGELSWENATGWYAGVTVEWAPEKTYIDHRNTFAADPYSTAGLRVGRRAAKGLSWFAEVRNVFDETFAATTGVIESASGTDTAQFLPGDGRAFYAGAEWRW